MFYGLYTSRNAIRLLEINEDLLEIFKAKYSDQMWRLVAIPSRITTKQEAIKEVKATIYARRPSLKDGYKRTSVMAYRTTGSAKAFAMTYQSMVAPRPRYARPKPLGKLASMPVTIL